MPRPKASEPVVNFTLGLPRSLRDTFTARAAEHSEIPTLLIRKLIREWLRKHPSLNEQAVPTFQGYPEL